jgi:hypothetical protein
LGGTPIALSQTQLTSLINPATASLPGALPAWPNNTTSFFRGDGSYATLNVRAVSGAAPLASPSFTGSVTFPVTGSTQCLHVNTSGLLSGTGSDCGAGGGTGANPTATAGPAAVNGVATTFLRSDGAPAVQLGSNSQKGIVQVDGTTISASSGVISAVNTGTVTSIATTCGVSGGTITTTGTIQATTTPNPQTGTNYPIVTTDCGKVVNLSNASNQIPTLPQAGSAGFLTGWATEVCNQGAGTQTITPATSTIGGAATYVLAAGTAAAPKCIGVVSDGVNYQLDMTGPGGSSSSGANPTATAADTAVNGVATTFMRSDAAPAIQKATSAQFGLVEVDNTSIGATAGVIGAKALTGDCTTIAGAVAATCYQHQPQVVNNWYAGGAKFAAQFGSNSATAANTIRCYPDFFNGPATISSLGFKIGTTNAGNIQAAIYANNATTMRPTGTVLGSTASMSTTVSTEVNASVSIVLTGNPIIWFCSNLDNATATTTGLNPLLAMMAALLGSSSQGNVGNGANLTAGVSVAQTFNTWPDLTSGSFTEITGALMPVVKYKIGSVP